MKDTLDLQKFYPEEIGITEVTQNEKEIYIHVSVQSKNCTCPKCGVASEHKHGTYKRKLQDLPILGMILSILVYTFFSRMFDLMLPPVAKHSIVVA